MTRTSGRLPRLATLFAGAVIVAAACTPAATNAPTAGPTAAPQPTTVASAVPALVYPDTGEVTCPSGGTAGSFNGKEYKGNLKSIEAPDAATVIFNLCATDVAFLQKLAFAVFYINDSGWITTHAADGTIKDDLNGTGPYELEEWRKGDSLIFSAYDNYWDKANYPLVPNAVLRWAANPALACRRCRAARSRASRSWAPATSTRSGTTRACCSPRPPRARRSTRCTSA